MSKEIERRFLVIPPPEPKLLLREFNRYKIRQGYFSAPPRCSLRIRIEGRCVPRIITRETQHAFATIKEGEGFVREEKEIRIELRTAEFLMTAASWTISKTRYIPVEQPFPGQKWMIDVFGPPLTGLTLAEVELESAEERLCEPGRWFGKTKEVTNSISNIMLAQISTEFAKMGLELGKTLPPPVEFIELILKKKEARDIKTWIKRMEADLDFA